jgi:murein L,D-transpeptidase YafK
LLSKGAISDVTMASKSRSAAWRAAAIAGALVLGVEAAAASWSKESAPIPDATLALITARGATPSSPILIRAFKKEAELEVWKKARDGRFVHLKTFPICRWSGQLGPKRKQGDRQTPEGFYAIAPRQMNPNSAYHLSFDTGFPNAYDRANGASGAYLMVHGTCSSAGCYAMTDKQIEEIYALAREAFAGGQQAFQFQAYPFRMTAQNMARHRSDPNIGFWRQLKEGSDRFEATGEELAVGVAGARYAFAPSKDPAKEARAKARLAEEEGRIASLIADGAAAVRTTYSDGGQHPSFRALALAGAPTLGEVSRPEALAFAGREIVITPARPKRPTQVAEAKPAVAQAAEPQASEPELVALAGPVRAELSLLFSLAPLVPTGTTTVQATLVGSVGILSPALSKKAPLKIAAR